MYHVYIVIQYLIYDNKDRSNFRCFLKYKRIVRGDNISMKSAKRERNNVNPNEKALHEGIDIYYNFMLFKELNKQLEFQDDIYNSSLILSNKLNKNTIAYVSYEKSELFKGGYQWYGMIYLNVNYQQSPAQWAYVIAHSMLHLVFGHFDAENMPKNISADSNFSSIKQDSRSFCDMRLWNEACDIYVAKFLEDMKFGKPAQNISLRNYSGPTTDERVIYNYLLTTGFTPGTYRFGTASMHTMDMIGLEHPAVYDPSKNESNIYSAAFAQALAYSAATALSQVGINDTSQTEELTAAKRAQNWFINNYPLLGGLAAGFKIIENYNTCITADISIAAVNVETAEIYVNPAANLNEEELKFVLAHECLHAGLGHYERCQGRDAYLWNIACDFVINGWLREMQIGEMPERGELYDESLAGQSAEEIYDTIVREFRQYSKLSTLRGYGKGDIIGGRQKYNGTTSLDDFFRGALLTGLEYHKTSQRGYIPAALIEEIRALAMPPIPWDVELGYWFEMNFVLKAKQRTYARPSRRQGSTPDIPRPRYVPAYNSEHSYTFGVVIDTSGSMDAKLIGYALGAVASFAAAKEVPCARVVFCDAAAYDAGYLAPEEISGRVAIKGRGGTILQPGVDLLINSQDFPRDAPILIITDGYIENHMTIPRTHAFLIPQGRHLPFRAKGKVFYFPANAC